MFGFGHAVEMAILQAIQHARAVRPEHAAEGADVVLLPDYLGVAEEAFRETDLAALQETPCSLSEAAKGQAPPWLCGFCDGPALYPCGSGCGAACIRDVSRL